MPPPSRRTSGPWNTAQVPNAEAWPAVRERALAAIAEVVAETPEGVDVIAVRARRAHPRGHHARHGRGVPPRRRAPAELLRHVFRLDGESWEMLAYAGVAN